MNDFDYDVLQKKRIANSARSRVNGSRSKYVSLPSDNLTAAEKRKLNGDVIVYKLSEPISWAEFRGYPQDIQVKYFEFLRDEFHANRSGAIEVFGTNLGAFSSYVNDHQYLRGVLPRMQGAEDLLKIREWIAAHRGPAPLVEEPKTKGAEKKVSSPVAPTPMFYNVISSCEMNLSGKASEISQMIFNMFQSQNIIVSIVFDGVKTEDDRIP